MLNKVILLGRLTADPELKQTPNNISVATFSLAVERAHDRKQVDFINIAAWRKTAEFVGKYFNKGQLVAIDGSIQTRNYTDKNNVKRYVFEVIAENVHFAESKKSTATNTATPHDSSPNTNLDIMPTSSETNDVQANFGDYEEFDATDDDLPF